MILLPEASRVPAPAGPIYMVMRLYWPKEDAVNGTWKDAPIAFVFSERAYVRFWG